MSLLDPEIHPAVKMILNDFSGLELSNHGQKLTLLCFFVIFGFQIFFFDLQEICHLEREFETGLSTFINILSIFQVTFQIPFGEIRKHFMEKLVFISPSQLPQVFIILLQHLSYSIQYYGYIPSVSFTTQ